MKINTRSEIVEMRRVSREGGKGDFEGLQQSEAKPRSIIMQFGTVKSGFDKNASLLRMVNRG